jgi:23S rRNA pseudouridine1911/1915/1917 synthase
MALKDLSRPATEISRTVTDAEAGSRLDHVLAAWITWRSRSDLQARVRGGTVLLNGSTAKAASRPKAGDVVTVLVTPPSGAAVDACSIPLRVLHEESLFLVLDKPPGAVIHPVGRYVLDTLMNVLHARYRPLGVVPMVVHRLDKDTSGVLVVAKDEKARKRLGAAFEEREVEKEYLAIVRGRMASDRTIDLPIGPDPSGANRTKMACVQGGRPSLTAVRVERRFDRATLVRCVPHTGRQHQIRVHLAAIGHPILADALYGGGEAATAAELGIEGASVDDVVLDRLALHAGRLVVPHPETGRRLVFEAPLAADLRALVDRMTPGPGQRA